MGNRAARVTTVSAALCAAWIVPAGAADNPVEPRRGELVNMVRQDCGSCHGLTMKGGYPAATNSARRRIMKYPTVAPAS